MTDVGTYPREAAGDHVGIGFPTTIEALLADGPGFLTRAFRATGAIEPDNSVTAIRASREFFGGGMGRKLTLTVEFGRAVAGLPRDLFVKFPRDFGDPLRHLFTPPMEPEVRFALMSRQAGFPVPVPECLFADYDRSVPAGILITERVRFGEGGIEPAHDKSMDHLLPNAIGHYRALTRVMAQLAAAHKAGAIGPAVAEQFAFDPAAEPKLLIPFDADGLAEKIAILRSFVHDYPQLLPPALRDAAFLDSFAADVMLVPTIERDLLATLQRDAEAVALCHWNMNVDNAWFWRDGDGVLRAGLLDWGSAGQMHLAQAFFGMTCAAEPDFLDHHRDELLALLVEEYRQRGGPALRPERLAEQVKLAIAVLGTAWMLDAPTILLREVPEAGRASGRHDPMIAENFLARAQLQLITTFLNEWRATRIGEAVRRFAASRAIA